MFNSAHQLLGLGVSLFLRDDFSGPAKKIRASFNALNDDVKGKIIAQTQALQNRGLAMTTMGIAAMYGMRQMVMSTKEFNDTLRLTQGIMGDVSGKKFPEMQDLALKMSRSFPYSATQIAKGFLEISKAGVTGIDNIKQMTTAILNLGTAADIHEIGGEEGAANMLLNIMAQFGKTFKEAQKVTDQITQAANLTTVDVPQIFETFRYGGSFLRQYNMSLEETLALTSALAQSGVKGSIAGTTLGNFYTYLSSAIGPHANKKQKEALATMGLGMKDFYNPKTGGFNDPFKVFTKIQQGMSKLSLMQRANVMIDLVGRRGARASNLLNFLSAMDSADKPAKSIQELLKQISDPKLYANTAERVKQAKMQSYASQIQLFDNAWFEFKVAFVDAIMPVVVPALHGLTKAFQLLASFGKTGLGKIVFAGTAIATFLYTIGGAAMWIMSTIQLSRLTGGAANMFRGIRGFIMGFQMLVANMGGNYVYLNSIGRLIRGASGRFVAMWATRIMPFLRFSWVGTAATAIIRFLGPWGALIAGLITVGTLVYKYSDEISNFFSNLGTAIKNFFVSIPPYLYYMGRALNPMISSEDNLAKLKTDLAQARGEVVEKPSQRSWSPGDDTMVALREWLAENNNQPIQLTIVDPTGKILTTKQIDRSQRQDVLRVSGYK